MGTLVRRHCLFTRMLNPFYTVPSDPRTDGGACWVLLPMPCFIKVLAGYVLRVFMLSLRRGLIRMHRIKLSNSSGGQSSDSVFKGAIVVVFYLHWPLDNQLNAARTGNAWLHVAYSWWPRPSDRLNCAQTFQISRIQMSTRYQPVAHETLGAACTQCFISVSS